MRIALLTDGIFPFVIGGMQKHAFYLAKHFLNNGIDLTVFHCVVDEEIPADAHERLVAELEVPEGAVFHSVCLRFPRMKPGIPGHYIIENKRFSKAVYHKLLEEKPFDFIYAKGLSAWHALEHKNDLPPIGVQFHGLEMFQPAFTLKSKLEQHLLRGPIRTNLRKSDLVFSYGGQIRQILLNRIGLPNPKIIPQYGGVDQSIVIDADAFKAPGAPLRFLFIGRNERRKGYQELRSVIQGLLPKQEFRFSFVGQIDRQEQLQNERIHYYGEVRSAKTYFDIIDQHDVLVVPSISEGVPTVILEAMARGLTVIATDVGAIADLVLPEHGWLIPPQNNQALETALVDVMETETKDLQQKQQKARAFIAEHFNWEKLAKDLLDAIRQHVSA